MIGNEKKGRQKSPSGKGQHKHRPKVEGAEHKTTTTKRKNRWQVWTMSGRKWERTGR